MKKYKIPSGTAIRIGEGGTSRITSGEIQKSPSGTAIRIGEGGTSRRTSGETPMAWEHGTNPLPPYQVIGEFHEYKKTSMRPKRD